MGSTSPISPHTLFLSLLLSFLPRSNLNPSLQLFILNTRVCVPLGRCIKFRLWCSHHVLPWFCSCWFNLLWACFTLWFCLMCGCRSLGATLYSTSAQCVVVEWVIWGFSSVFVLAILGFIYGWYGTFVCGVSLGGCCFGPLLAIVAPTSCFSYCRDGHSSCIFLLYLLGFDFVLGLVWYFLMNESPIWKKKKKSLVVWAVWHSTSLKF